MKHVIAYSYKVRFSAYFTVEADTPEQALDIAYSRKEDIDQLPESDFESEGTGDNSLDYVFGVNEAGLPDIDELLGTTEVPSAV
jgi:hypothetical protein